LQAEFLCAPEAAFDGLGQLAVLIPFTPHWPHGVDDEAGRQFVPGGDGRLIAAYRAVLDDPRAALRLDARAAGLRYGGCHAPAVLQLCVGGIDNRIHRFLGQVALADFEPALAGDGIDLDKFAHTSNFTRYLLPG
jgi:hypothetical protein